MKVFFFFQSTAWLRRTLGNSFKLCPYHHPACSTDPGAGGLFCARAGVASSLVKSNRDTQVHFGQHQAGLGREPASLATFRAGFCEASLDFYRGDREVDLVTFPEIRGWGTVSHLSLDSGPWGLFPESGARFLNRVSPWKNQGPYSPAPFPEDPRGWSPTASGIRGLKTKVALRPASHPVAGSRKSGMGRRPRVPDTFLLSTNYILDMLNCNGVFCI